MSSFLLIIAITSSLHTAIPPLCYSFAPSLFPSPHHHHFLYILDPALYNYLLLSNRYLHLPSLVFHYHHLFFRHQHHIPLLLYSFFTNHRLSNPHNMHHTIPIPVIISPGSTPTTLLPHLPSMTERTLYFPPSPASNLQGVSHHRDHLVRGAGHQTASQGHNQLFQRVGGVVEPHSLAIHCCVI